MKKTIIICLLVIASYDYLQAQNIQSYECDSLLGYGKDEKDVKMNAVFLIKPLEATVVNNPLDNHHGVFATTRFFKTEKSSGIWINFFFLNCGGKGKIDESVKLKLEFLDQSTIFIKPFKNGYCDSCCLVNFFAGGSYGNNFELMALRTKLITKISISGDDIDSSTYVVDPTLSLQFMMGMACLTKLLN